MQVKRDIVQEYKEEERGAPIKRDKPKTEKGMYLFKAVIRQYNRYKAKYKRRPVTLHLGLSQKEIVDQDEGLQKLLSEGDVQYNTHKQSQLKFK